jgi:hypothetical protein
VSTYYIQTSEDDGKTFQTAFVETSKLDAFVSYLALEEGARALLFKDTTLINATFAEDVMREIDPQTMEVKPAWGF